LHDRREDLAPHDQEARGYTLVTVSQQILCHPAKHAWHPCNQIGPECLQLPGYRLGLLQSIDSQRLLEMRGLKEAPGQLKVSGVGFPYQSDTGRAVAQSRSE
jgi:hypothetical protein